MGTVFFAGIYGVGKSTIIEKLSALTGLPAFSAGDLISARNGEKYGANKVVRDKSRNQRILVDCVSELLGNNHRIMLAGHFCIVTKEGQIDRLPSFVFDGIELEKIILLEASAETIVSHLSQRDGKSYSVGFIKKMLNEERLAARYTSDQLHIPLAVYEMTFSEKDEKALLQELQETNAAI